jgi:hypothetical protein
MARSRNELMGRWDDGGDPFAYALGELRPVQLQAAEELLHERRGEIRVLDRRAHDAEIDAISSLQDVVPLLFSDATYKSYPDAFIRGGRWDRMNAWLSTLSRRAIDVDVEAATSIDGWIELLHRAGHYVMSTSGTSGRPSFLATSAADHAALGNSYAQSARVMVGATGNPDRRAFLAMPRSRTTVAQITMELLAARLCGGPTRYLTEEPLRADDIARMGRLRQAIHAGTADPGEIAAAEADAGAQARAMGDRLGEFVEDVLAHHEEPLFVAGTFGMLWRVVEAARARGIPDGSFSADTVLLTGGGLKGVQAPPDVRDRVRAFFGDAVGQFEAYGMSELVGPFARCSSGRFHVPPTTLVLLLDKAGENATELTSGVVTGRFAAIDLLIDDRWGGLISGDRTTVCFEPCDCGRASPQVVDIVRYVDLPEGDDKLSCAATMDAYVRGEIEATR